MGNIDVRKLSVCPLWVSFLFQLFSDIVLLFSHCFTHTVIISPNIFQPFFLPFLSGADKFIYNSRHPIVF